MTKLSLVYTATLSMGAVLLFFIFQLLSYFLIISFNNQLDDGKLLAYSTLLTGVCIIVQYHIINDCQKINIIKNIRFKTKDFFTSLIGLAIFIGISKILLGFFENNPLQFIEKIINNTNWLILAFSIVVIAPIYEEILFRGIILNMLIFHTTPTIFNKYHLSQTQVHWVGITLTSLLFAISHLQYNIIGIFLIFIFSCFLCSIQLKFKSIGLTILIHSLNNLLAFYPYIKERL